MTVSEVEIDVATPFIRRVTVRSSSAWSLAPEVILERRGRRWGGRLGMGAAGLAVRARRSQITLPAALAQHAAQRLDWPQPRLALGLALRGLASAAIDVSDGLLADLGHVCAAGGVGARLDLAALPLPAGALALASHEELLGAGDDYELCFAVPPSREAAVPALAARLGCPLSRIGRIEAEPGLRLVDAAGRVQPAPPRGHDHFR